MRHGYPLEQSVYSSNKIERCTNNSDYNTLKYFSYLPCFRISMETASLGGLAGFQYLSPNHIIKSPVH